MTNRRQATLYVPPPFSTAIDSLRTRFNPFQSSLIRAHVTLCREDEVRDWDALASCLNGLAKIDVSLHFDRPVRNGNFVYLPTIGSSESFHALRSSLLETPESALRKHDPHITLIHPRNGTCSKSVFDEISSACEPFSIDFRSVTLIEQENGDQWQDLTSFA